jgi:CRP/FNR family transcriptional regulator, cyclic AMP receptor protein
MRHFDGDVNMDGASSAKGFWGLLTGREQAVLSTLGLTRDFRPGITMCHEGDPATHLYVLVTGWVKILSVTSDGHERVLALRGQGDIVGEMAGETTGHRTATVRAVDPVCALIVGYDRFSSFLDSHSGAAHAYRRTMTQRLSDTAKMLRRHSVTSGAQRLAALLLDLAERHGRSVDGEIHVAMPLSQEELASLAGTSRATVSRAFKTWRQRGFIRTGQRHITITDPRSLRQIAGQSLGCAGGLGRDHRGNLTGPREVDPALPALVPDGYGHDGRELFVVDAVVAVPDDRPVDDI